MNGKKAKGLRKLARQLSREDDDRLVATRKGVINAPNTRRAAYQQIKKFAKSTNG